MKGFENFVKIIVQQILSQFLKEWLYTGISEKSVFHFQFPRFPKSWNPFLCWVFSLNLQYDRVSTLPELFLLFNI